MKLLFVVSIVLLLFPTSASSQSDTCPAIVEEALSATAEHCAAAGPNEVCFGHRDIDTVVNCDLPSDFDSPGDTVSLASICALRLSAMLSTGQWGVAKMQLHATDADQEMTYILLGEVEVQNAASALSERQVWIKTDTEIHSGPGSNYSGLGTLTAGDVIRVNACNCTGNWLRTTLDGGRVGWILARDVTMLADTDALPIVQADTPVYAPMQAFIFRGGSQARACAQVPASGILIQVPVESSEVSLQINGVEVALNSTIFVQSQPGGSLTIAVLDGVVRVTTTGFTAFVPAGARAVVPMSEANSPTGELQVEPYSSEDVANLPVSLLPDAVDPMIALNEETPRIVGVKSCSVLSDSGETVCPLHFVNLDGDEITRMSVEFVYAPQGEWTGSTVEGPELIDGDNISGQLAWRVSCSLGSANFIGPIRWSVAITDEMGHISQPFEASYNCVAG